MAALEPVRSPAVIIRPDETPAVAYSDADFSITEDTARQLLEATPENTRRAYERNWAQFATWCTEQGRVPLPATAQTLADYIARLVGIGLAPATIEQAIGTIRSRHRDAGYKGRPDTTAALKLLNAYRREWAAAGNKTRKSTPILLPALRAMVGVWDPGTPAGLRNRALLLVGFTLMARRSELSALNIGDLAAHEEGMTVTIRLSKTDQAARGVQVAVPFAQHAEMCAVRAVNAWRAELAGRGLATGALFRPVDRHGKIGGEPGTAGGITDRLTGKSINNIVRRSALLAGLREHYTAHGLRAGAATVAYAAGIPVSVIAAHGRWSLKSPVVLGYIRPVDQWKNNAMKGIGL
jgi:integrase